MSGKMTVADLVQRTYEARWAGQHSEETSHKNGMDVGVILGMKRYAASLTQSDVDQVRRELRTRNLRPATINRKLSALSTMLKVARSHGIELPPVSISRERIGQGRIRVLTSEEEASLLDALAGLNVAADKADALLAANLCRFLLIIGCRASEALGATWRDLDFVDGRSWLSFTETKNGSARRLPLSTEAQVLIPEHRGDGLDAPLWPIKYKRFRYLFDRAREAAGLDSDVCPHVLRHTCITRLVRKGVDPARVKVWAGHKRIETTMLYVHLNGGDLTEIADLE